MDGAFVRGDVVEVRTPDGELLGRGVARVSSSLLILVRALRVDEIATVLVAVLATFAGGQSDSYDSLTMTSVRQPLARALEYVRNLSPEKLQAIALEAISLFPADSVRAVLTPPPSDNSALLERYTKLVRGLAIIESDVLYIYSRHDQKSKELDKNTQSAHGR